MVNVQVILLPVIVLLSGAVLIAADCEWSNYNGEPGCKTLVELQVKNYRNHFDPTRYWVCVAQNVKAASVKCLDQTAWSDLHRRCIPWIDWYWTVPVNPPSCPDRNKIVEINDNYIEENLNPF